MKLRPEQRYAKREKATLDHLIDLVDGIQLRRVPHRSFGRRLGAQAFSGAVLDGAARTSREDGILYTKDASDLQGEWGARASSTTAFTSERGPQGSSVCT